MSYAGAHASSEEAVRRCTVRMLATSSSLLAGSPSTCIDGTMGWNSAAATQVYFGINPRLKSKVANRIQGRVTQNGRIRPLTLLVKITVFDGILALFRPFGYGSGLQRGGLSDALPRRARSLGGYVVSRVSVRR